MKMRTLVLLTAVSMAAGVQASIFSDPMESGSSWTVNSDADTTHTFGWDYSTVGIPSAPNSGDSSTLGLRFGANTAAGTASEINAVVSGLSMSGNYAVSFDFWINVNGPFPGGGSGSTEFIGGGIGMNGSATGRNGSSIMITGEGGSSRDWRLYKNDGEQFFASGQYNPALGSNNGADPLLSATFPGQQAPALQQSTYAQQTGTLGDGAAGFGWHEMLITVDSDAETAKFEVDGLWVGTVDNKNGGTVADVTGRVGVIYADLFSSVSDNSDLSFGVIDNFTVAIPEPASVCLIALVSGGIYFSRRFFVI